MRQQAAATAAACTGEQSEFTGDGSDMMPAIGTPVAANTSLGAPLTLTLPMSPPRLGDIGRTTIYCATLTRRAIRLGTTLQHSAPTRFLHIRRRDQDQTWIPSVCSVRGVTICVVETRAPQISRIFLTVELAWCTIGGHVKSSLPSVDARFSFEFAAQNEILFSH